jgi:site-specific recombinase XerD
MSIQVPTPRPLFDTREMLEEAHPDLVEYIQSLSIPQADREHKLCMEFLKSYANSNDTFTAYRREVERLLHWSWLVCKKPLIELSRNDIRDYLKFIHEPPLNWMSVNIAHRFKQNALGEREANPAWRPFVVKISKNSRRLGQEPDKRLYKLSNKSIEAIFGVLSSLFSYLQQEEYLDANPVALIRQKKGYIQRQQTRRVARRLSSVQWHYVITTAECMAKNDALHERTLFLMSAFYLLGLRISELAYNEERVAEMGNFAPDKRDMWWYNTIGKGNKIRDVAVPDELLSALKRYRVSLNLTPLPHRGETTPLFPKLKGKDGLGTRQIRNIVQSVFNLAIDDLRAMGKIDEADDLESATVHWLRHTAISTEIEYRPREHIRDDVGHENPSTMDKYIDTDRVARHQSAKSKPLKPGIQEDYSQEKIHED